MESELSPDKEKKETSREPINEYQWDDLRRDRELGHYPWTHLLKPPLEGEITAEDIIRETTPRRSMSREFSRSRTHSPVDGKGQKILNLDSSPGSSRKHGDEGEDEGVHIPNFSKEVSLDSEEDVVNQAMNAFICRQPESSMNTLEAPMSTPKNVSPKGILKRRVPDTYIGVTETREKTKCCHPLVNKIKHLADKTLSKLEKNEGEKSPLSKRKKHKESQEIRELKSSPGAVRRQKFSAIKLGDSDEMSKTMSLDTPPRKKKEHIYEDIEESKCQDRDKSLHFSPDTERECETNNKENESYSERKSLASQDPSLVIEDEASLKSDEHVMEKLHKIKDSNKEAVILDEEMDPEEPNVDEIFQNQLEETRPKNDSPNITITEIFDDEVIESSLDQASVPIESSPTPSPQVPLHKNNGVEISENDWSKTSSDHEYEIIEKPATNIIYVSPDTDTKPSLIKTDDELSSTTSLERKYLQHPSDEEEQHDDKENEGISNAELLQKDIEERYFVNTPSTMSRTECEISTSQVDSSALENLPLKRDSRQNAEGIDVKIQQRIKESAGKIKSQAGKLKTKLQSMKMPEKPKINMPERSKFKMPDRPKFTLPDKPKFTLPDKRKFSLPDRPKFKKINLSEKLSFGDKKKFTLPERPKFSVPDFPKFKMPDKSKISFPSLGKRKSSKPETTIVGSTPDVRNIAPDAPVEYEAKTFPRLFNRKNKKELPKTSSSPNLDREETPPATFTFTRMKKQPTQPASYIPDSPSEPREYGSFDAEVDERRQFETTYDFDKLDSQYTPDQGRLSHSKDDNDTELTTERHSPIKEEYSHVINEIDNDEFFVRPRGISRENIQVREYLSDEIRQAFKIPKNALALMGSNSGVNDENIYANEPEADPELMLDDNVGYSTEDLNDRDDGYYTFPPVRPSRAKRKKKDAEIDTVQYIDENMTNDIQFSEIDLGLSGDQRQHHLNHTVQADEPIEMDIQHNLSPCNELRSIHEYANDDVIQYPEDIPVQSQTLPMPPQRKKKFGKRDFRHSSLNDFKDIPASDLWEEAPVQNEDIIVYRTEHEYVVPQTENTVTDRSPLPPRRNRSRSSRGTSLCDDDRTSHGAESLTMDTHGLPADYIESDKHTRQESPGYATVDKSAYAPNKGIRRSQSKTPPVRRRKSHSSERKYHTVQPVSKNLPDRPPRKKSSTSLMTLDSFSKRSLSGDLTQYVEIDEPQIGEVHKDLISGEVVKKMKDRPLPPPPRPPRGPKRRKSDKNSFEDHSDGIVRDESMTHADNEMKNDDIVEIEVSTQTDPLPDDIDFELGMEENLDFSMSSSLRDIVNEEPYRSKSHSKIGESPRISRPTSRSEKSFKFSDPKISELSKSNIGRTSPTVILVERRVSSPTRINERDEMLTEASLTVQHIDIDEAHIPDVPPLPRPKSVTNVCHSSRKTVASSDDQALERVTETSRDVQLDNLVTQRLQVRDLDVGRLNVSELQASKILVSDIEGMTLQVTELDSKSGHISVSGIEFSQSVIDEIVKKFAEISTNATTSHTPHEAPRPVSREEQTQTDVAANNTLTAEKSTLENDPSHTSPDQSSPPPPPPKPSTEEEVAAPPQRPPPPDLTPLLYSYLQDMTMPPASYYHRPTALRDRPFTEFHDAQLQSPPPPTRRAKRRPAAPHSESSSDEAPTRPSPRRMPAPVRPHEPTITEAGANFLRVCHNSISRTIRSIFNSFVSYISGTEDKKDVQMALVIFLVLIAGLIMFGLSDSRTIHHHHWEFFNPPDGKQ